MDRLILVRHGATAWNANGYCQGHKDVALNETGERQIALLREALAGETIDHAFASPLQRAQQTARILGHEPEVIDDLIEINRGHWEGHDPAEIKRRWGKLHKQWYDDPAGLAMPGGESFDELWERVGLLEQTLDRPGTVLACAHKALNRALVAKWTGLPTKGVWQLPQPQSSVNVLVRDGNGWRAETIGDVSHLPAELRSSS